MKYLVSLYFDDKTNQQIVNYMKAVAAVTGNEYMIANEIPPHITISSFETENIDEVLPKLATWMRNFSTGEIKWVGCGAFQNSILYLSLVLNAYLQDIMQCVYDVVADCPDVEISRFYRPFQWLPHTTIGKKMTAEELTKGFDVVQRNFHILQGRVIKIGLAKASPYEELAEWNLK